MPKINSLYELIKQKSKEKGRPLKVISDWDETLFSFRATAVYKISNSNSDFKKFFEEFWNNASVKVEDKAGSAKKVFLYEGKDEKIKEGCKKFIETEEKKKKNPKAGIKSLIEAPEMHALTISEELLQCLKEDLISELVFVTTTRTSERGKMSSLAQSKEKRFAKNFGKFPNVKLGIMMVKRINNQNKPHRWEWIRDNHPNFDMYVDDDAGWITTISKHFPDKTYAITDYKGNRHVQVGNLYRIKNTVSDLTDEDIAKVAEEYKNKKDKEAKQQQRERERERETKSHLLNDRGWYSDFSFGSFISDGLQKEKDTKER